MQTRNRRLPTTMAHRADEVQKPVVDPRPVGEEECRTRGEVVEEEQLLLDADSSVISLLRLFFFARVVSRRQYRHIFH